MKDDDLDLWTEDFRQPDSLALPSTDEIVAQSGRDRRKERVEWATQIAGLTFAMTVFTWLVVSTRSTLFAVFAAVVMPILFALFAWFVILRVGAARNDVTTVGDHVARAVRHRRVNHRLARASLAALVVLTIAFFVWLPFLTLSRVERFAAEPWRAVVGVVASIAVFGGGFAWTARSLRKTRRELDRWIAVEAALRDD
jgi:hypothetical protein